MTEVKVRRISPSQLESYHRCARRWGFEYRAGQREGFSSAAQAGTEVHKVLEEQGPWDKEWTSPEGKTYPIGSMAALLHAQTPEGVVAREQRFEVELEGVPFVGVTDFFSEEIVGDYKSTSNKRNAKTVGGKDESKDLLLDPQRLLYTRFVPTAKRMIWLYGAWADMSVTKREVPVDIAADKERFKLRVLQPAETMLATPDSVDPLSLKPNVKACTLFPPFGCRHKSKCFPPGKLAPVVTKSKEGDLQMSSLIERLRAKAAAGGGDVDPEPAKTKAAHTVAAEEKYNFPAAPTVPAKAEAKAINTFLDSLEATKKAEDVKASEDAAAEKYIRELAGRIAPVVSIAPVVTERPAPVAQSVQQPVDDKQYIIDFLYVDCIPLTLPFENAFVYIAKAIETAEGDLQVPHYGLVDFGRGGPAVAAQLRSDLSGKRIPALYTDTKTPESKACLSVLMSVARHVVRGVF